MSDNRFTRENEIVTDNITELMWQDDNSVNTRYDWQEANHFAAKLSLGGFNDWRLPSIDELRSILDKNKSPNLDIIFKNRPFASWTSSLNSDPNYEKVVYPNEDITATIDIEISHISSPLFVRYVRNKKEESGEKIDYKTNISNLTCRCRNWLLLRSNFDLDDPRRLCKHLIRQMNDSNISTELNKYKSEIYFYKDKDKGFADTFNYLLTIPNTSYTVMYKHPFEWMNIFDVDGKRYGILLDGFGLFYWAKKTGMPDLHKKVEDFFLDKKFLVPARLTLDEMNQIKQKIKSHVDGIEIANSIHSPSYLSYDIKGDQLANDEELLFSSIHVTSKEIEVKLYNDSFIIQREMIEN